ncbi:hypothetical protein GOV12_04290 [Candidatus Pacearchaeota archaeon]|nr:hypothetical protein [Candidatus Pacearchaeota archaeon]
MNKRGAEMAIGTIIVIILALVVLVVVIYGFTVGWGNLWQRITGFAPKADVSTHVQSCQLSCTTEAKADYCKKRNVLFEENGKRVSFKSCEDLQAQRGIAIGLDSCPAIDCRGTENDGTCAYFGGEWQKVPCVEPAEEVTDRVSDVSDQGENTNCCRITCDKLLGSWSEKACDSETEINRFDQVTDRKDNNPSGYEICCVTKPTG